MTGRAPHKRLEPVRYLHGEWERAAGRMATNPPLHGPNDAWVALQPVSDAAAGTVWKGRTGGTDHMALEALIDIALKAGLLKFTGRSQRRPSTPVPPSRRRCPVSSLRAGSSPHPASGTGPAPSG